MELVVGAILDGKVTGITKFGAFVALPDGKSGMVHISEVASSYVSEISDHLQEGQEVKVKLISIADNGKLNLSIKKAMPEEAPRPFVARRPAGDRPPFQNGNRGPDRPFQGGGRGGDRPFQGGGGRGGDRPFQGGGRGGFDDRRPKQSTSTELSFEDRMKLFMQDSETKMHDIKHNMDKKTGKRRK